MSDIPELRHLYYSRLFPVQSLLHWLKDDNPLTNREFSFLVGDEIILRYLSFEDEKAFGEALSKKNPYKIDVGAIYSSPPNQKDKSISFVPLRKEFVLDMDINVYDDVRHCCQQTAICLKCWPLIQAGMHVLDRALQEDFDFQKRLWVFSGRRGIHCWVWDDRARKADNATRKAILDYLTFTSSSPLRHPSLQRAYQTLLPYFEEVIVRQQNFLQSEQDKKKILDLIPFRYHHLLWTNHSLSPYDKWCHLKKRLQLLLNTIIIKDEERKDFQLVLEFLPRLVLTMIYPRLDQEVSKQINHLLKIPFSIHPDTSKICIPLNVKQVEDRFDPAQVPTLFGLQKDLDLEKKASCPEDIPHLTQFRKALEYFNQVTK